MNKKNIALIINHEILEPFATDQDIIDGCKMCVEYSVRSCCVFPVNVQLAAKRLEGSNTYVSTVISDSYTKIKALETYLAGKDGAKEFETVMNIGAFLSGHYSDVQKGIEAVVTVAEPYTVKVILDISYLNQIEVIWACEIIKAAGVNFVKIPGSKM